MFNQCIIMAGGTGTRLWPASTSKHPKQFMQVTSAGKDKIGKTFCSLSIERGLEIIDPKEGQVIIMTTAEQVPLVVETCTRFNSETRSRIVIIAEPAPRNTAAAIACATVYINLVCGSSQNIAVLSSDHIIQPLTSFKVNMGIAELFTKQDNLVLLGVAPSSPETGYGYIEAIERIPVPPGQMQSVETQSHIQPEVFKIRSFREKPDAKTAQEYLDTGRFYWNSGMFAFSSLTILRQFKYYAPEVLLPFNKLPKPNDDAYTTQRNVRILSDWPGLREAYAVVKSISFDYAIVEKSIKAVMVCAGFEWRDVGSWDEYSAVIKDTGAETYQVDTESCFVDSDMPVALCGVKDLIVVARSGKNGGHPSVLVMQKGMSQRIRDVVKKISDAGRTDLL